MKLENGVAEVNILPIGPGTPDFATADGTQAWAAQADLVVNPRDAEVCENVIRSTLAERKRLLQPYLDARRRIETE